MQSYKPVPVSAAAAVGEQFTKSIVVIACWDPQHQLLHITTWGRDPADKLTATVAGELVAAALEADLEHTQPFEDFRVRAIVQLTIALEAEAELRGGLHDEDCPADDTCRCSRKPENDHLNAAIRRGRELLGLTDSAPTAVHFPGVRP